MSAALGFVVVLGVPVAMLVLLVKAVDARQRRRDAAVARQIDVTDAIHREFGAIVAPTVRRVRGGWRVRLPMDPRDPRAARVMTLAVQTLGPTATVEVALATTARARPRPRLPHSTERIASAMSA